MNAKIIFHALKNNLLMTLLCALMFAFGLYALSLPDFQLAWLLFIAIVWLILTIMKPLVQAEMKPVRFECGFSVNHYYEALIVVWMIAMLYLMFDNDDRFQWIIIVGFLGLLMDQRGKLRVFDDGLMVCEHWFPWEGIDSVQISDNGNLSVFRTPETWYLYNPHVKDKKLNQDDIERFSEELQKRGFSLSPAGAMYKKEV